MEKSEKNTDKCQVELQISNDAAQPNVSRKKKPFVTSLLKWLIFVICGTFISLAVIWVAGFVLNWYIGDRQVGEKTLHHLDNISEQLAHIRQKQYARDAASYASQFQHKPAPAAPALVEKRQQEDREMYRNMDKIVAALDSLTESMIDNKKQQQSHVAPQQDRSLARQLPVHKPQQVSALPRLFLSPQQQQTRVMRLPVSPVAAPAPFGNEVMMPSNTPASPLPMIKQIIPDLPLPIQQFISSQFQQSDEPVTVRITVRDMMPTGEELDQMPDFVGNMLKHMGGFSSKMPEANQVREKMDTFVKPMFIRFVSDGESSFDEMMKMAEQVMNSGNIGDILNNLQAGPVLLGNPAADADLERKTESDVSHLKRDMASLMDTIKQLYKTVVPGLAHDRDMHQMLSQMLSLRQHVAREAASLMKRVRQEAPDMAVELADEGVRVSGVDGLSRRTVSRGRHLVDQVFSTLRRMSYRINQKMMKEHPQLWTQLNTDLDRIMNDVDSVDSDLSSGAGVRLGVNSLQGLDIGAMLRDCAPMINSMMSSFLGGNNGASGMGNLMSGLQSMMSGVISEVAVRQGSNKVSSDPFLDAIFFKTEQDMKKADAVLESDLDKLFGDVTGSAKSQQLMTDVDTLFNSFMKTGRKLIEGGADVEKTLQQGVDEASFDLEKIFLDAESVAEEVGDKVLADGRKMLEDVETEVENLAGDVEEAKQELVNSESAKKVLAKVDSIEKKVEDNVESLQSSLQHVFNNINGDLFKMLLDAKPQVERDLEKIEEDIVNEEQSGKVDVDRLFGVMNEDVDKLEKHVEGVVKKVVHDIGDSISQKDLGRIQSSSGNIVNLLSQALNMFTPQANTGKENSPNFAALTSILRGNLGKFMNVEAPAVKLAENEEKEEEMVDVLQKDADDVINDAKEGVAKISDIVESVKNSKEEKRVEEDVESLMGGLEEAGETLEDAFYQYLNDDKMDMDDLMKKVMGKVESAEEKMMDTVEDISEQVEKVASRIPAADLDILQATGEKIVGDVSHIAEDAEMIIAEPVLENKQVASDGLVESQTDLQTAH